MIGLLASEISFYLVGGEGRGLGGGLVIGILNEVQQHSDLFPRV